MIIAIVIDTFGDANGGTVTTKRLVEELKRRKHEVRVVCTGEHGENFYRVPGYKMPFVKKSMDEMNFSFGKGVKKIFRAAFDGVDVVQIQFPFPMSRNAVKVARQMNIPVIAGCHVQPQNVIGAMGKESKFMEKILHRLFNSILYNKVDAVHCPSQFCSELLKENGCKSDLNVISNGIPSEYVYNNNSVRPDWFGDKFVLVNIGRHALEKRQSLLIEGVKRSKYKNNIQLLLCGKGEDTASLIKQGSELPVKPLIEYVSMEDKLLYLNTSDMYLHSSVAELESLSCLEAMGCGLPCLIGDSPSSASSQFALDERFLFKMEDPDALASKIDYWYENRDSLESYKKMTLKKAAFFRFDKSLDQMEMFYKGLMVEKVQADSIMLPRLS